MVACCTTALILILLRFSYGARQFNVFEHAQGWLHAARPVEKVIPVKNAHQANDQYWCLNWSWDIYRDLKAFNTEPSKAKASIFSAVVFLAWCRLKQTAQS